MATADPVRSESRRSVDSNESDDRYDRLSPMSVVAPSLLPADLLPVFRNRPIMKTFHVKPQPSLLSPSRVESTDMRGMFNLFVMLLVALNIRLVVENVYKYGWLIPNPISVLTHHDSHIPVYWIYLFLLTFPGVTVAIERYVAPNQATRTFAYILHTLTLIVVLLVPHVAVSAVHGFFGGSIALLCCAAVYAMKMISYIQTCTDLHTASRLKCFDKIFSDKEMLEIAEKYPLCLTWWGWYEFVAFPTLVYQLRYPRTRRISKTRILRYVFEIVFCSGLITMLAEQYMRPLLHNAKTEMTKHYVSQSWLALITFTLERWLKLIVPSIYLWLIAFVGLFHSYLNLLAELTKFADRKFYEDWWNAVSFREYWQKWNMPVHAFLVRHVYGPLRSFGIPPLVNALLVFLLSGLVHEYIIVTPLHLSMNGLVSAAFIIQLPLIVLTDTKFVKDRPVVGNCLFWFTNCFTGQPAAILIFFLLKHQ